MTILSLLIFLHVLAAIIWVGGNVIIHILTAGANRLQEPVLLARRLHDTEFIGQKIFAPVSLLLFVLGFAILGLTQSSPFDAIWILSGIVGFGFSFVVGFFYLGPEAGKLAAEYESGGSPTERLGRFVTIARIEMTILLVVVFMMVVKPF